MNTRMKIFEAWFLNLNGDIDETLLSDKISNGNFYRHEVVNNMWIGFIGGITHADPETEYPPQKRIKELEAKVKELEYDLGQTQISLKYRATHLKSCEEALEARDA